MRAPLMRMVVGSSARGPTVPSFAVAGLSVEDADALLMGAKFGHVSDKALTRFVPALFAFGIKCPYIYETAGDHPEKLKAIR